MAFTQSERDMMRAHFEKKFKFLKFPVTGFQDILPALPQGPREEFNIQGWLIEAYQIGNRLEAYANWPYNNLDSFVTDMIDALEATEPQ